MYAICRRILESGDLETKLGPPQPEDFQVRPRALPEPAPERPARAPGLELVAGVERLPRPGALGDPRARALCLARFAHHELMAVEIFAWAILRWPELPAPLLRGLLGILSDEQRHCRMYLERLAAHGDTLADHALSDYFWKHVPAMSASPAGAAAFFASMGLTYEQGNLDFAPLYRDAFHRAGDEASASACDAVHRDEIEHVRFAIEALRTLARDAGRDPEDEIALYEDAVPFPLSAARAKGRHFETRSRQQAGLSERFIEYVRTARSPQELRAHPRQPGSRPGDEGSGS